MDQILIILYTAVYRTIGPLVVMLGCLYETLCDRLVKTVIIFHIYSFISECNL